MYYLIIIAFGVSTSISSAEFTSLDLCMKAKAKVERVDDRIRAECVEK